MTKRTYITKSGTTFEWEETPELVKYLNQLHKSNVGDTEKRSQNTPQES